MRERPELWTGPQRICWLCCLMEDFIGSTSLKEAPAIMSGAESVSDAPIFRSARQAIFNLRQIAPAFVTEQSIRYAVALYNQQDKKPYKIDAETLKFEKNGSFENSKIPEARTILSQPLPYEQRKVTFADPNREMQVQLTDDMHSSRVVIPPLPITPKPSTYHDLTHKPAGAITITLEELREVAIKMDKIDVDKEYSDRSSGNWLERLKAIELLLPDPGRGLKTGNAITLEGLKHLIGLPGSGKTTLLMLMGVWLGQQSVKNRHLKTLLLFPSIEVARRYLADLEFYGVQVGMLVGQSPETRRRHANTIAETVATMGTGGFGYSLDGANRFAENCVLPAFAKEDNVTQWAFGHAPCNKILQGTDRERNTRLRSTLCPLWTMCGRNRAPRELVQANVWVGHVISLDTDVPEQALLERMRYFELVARTFDVVIFDEADMAQNALDDYGTAALSISGAADSLHHAIQDQILVRVASGDNHRLADESVEFYLRDLAEFGTHNHSLIHTVQYVEKDNKAIIEHFENQLLTTNRIIAEIVARFDMREGYDELSPIPGFNKARALRSFWDSAAYTAFYSRNEEGGDGWEESELCAMVLGIESNILIQQRKTLIRYFRQYLAENLPAGRKTILDNISQHFLNVCFQDSIQPPGAPSAMQLLVTITFMILGYQRILPGTRRMVAEGYLQGSIISPNSSQPLRCIIPENIMGSLSGVRYRTEKAYSTRGGASNVELAYISFTGTPRMLMYQLHNLFEAEKKAGPAVLLTSATSFLEPSPAYHINVGPHYVLRAKREVLNTWRKSKYHFKWFPDKQMGDKPLRYSGAGEAQKKNLEKMLDALVTGGSDKSEIYKAIHHFDVRHDIYRKAAIVVNSYEQARNLKEHLSRFHRDVGRHTKAVVKFLKPGDRTEDFVTPAQVEKLGDDENCHIIIFPMLAIGRGVNIVFTKGPRVREAAIGSIYFLTRPHPSTDDMQLLTSLAARSTRDFNQHRFDEKATLLNIFDYWKETKRSTYRLAYRLLQEPLMASRLGPDLFKSFTANQMVAVLQTIGRGMRGDCPVQVYFVDAAWAPQSAEEKVDTNRDSMLVQMRAILEECINDADPVKRDVYKELYQSFLDPLQAVENVKSPDSYEATNPLEDDGFNETYGFIEE